MKVKKDTVNAVTDICNGIKAVAAGNAYISPQLSGWLIKRARPMSNPVLARLATLTPAERKVLKLLAAYQTSKEIA